MKKFKNKNLTASSKNWISRQFSDPYTKLAKQKGYRSRSAFKLIEINQKFKFLKNNLISVPTLDYRLVKKNIRFIKIF